MADPGYLPALIDLAVFEPIQSAWLPRFLDSVAAQTGNAGMSRCIRMFSSLYRGLRPDSVPVDHLPEPARLCEFQVRTTWGTRSDLSAAQVDTAIRLARAYPASITLVTGLANLSVIRAHPDRIMPWLNDVAALKSPSIVRAYALATLASIMHEQGRDEAAVELERRALRDPDWSLPGFRTTWASGIQSHQVLRALSTRTNPGALIRHVDSMSTATVEIERQAASEGDAWAQAKIVMERGVALLDRGRLHEAASDLRVALSLVDSIGDPSWRSYVRMRLGRALVKLGRSGEAEHYLIAARALGDTAVVGHFDCNTVAGFILARISSTVHT